MRPIKDVMLLGIVSGIVGNIGKVFGDEISLRMKISQRSFRETSAGVWVNKRSEALRVRGQVLGAISDFGMASLFGIVMVHMLQKTGKNSLLVKGAAAGMTFGALVTALLSMQPKNKVMPKDAASNLSYMLMHAIYGVITASVINKLGDSSLFKADVTKGVSVIVNQDASKTTILVPEGVSLEVQ